MDPRVPSMLMALRHNLPEAIAKSLADEIAAFDA
jgi:hypothetical protein